MNKLLLLLLLIGHVLGDYYFQSDNLAEEKTESFKSLIKHGLLYSVSLILVILPVFNLIVLLLALILSGIHLLIDLLKFRNAKSSNEDERRDLHLYLFDQALHLGSIVILSIVFIFLGTKIALLPIVDNFVQYFSLNFVTMCSWTLAILIIIQPCNITIKKILASFRPDLKDENKGHPNAGALIGILERFLYLFFLAAGQYSAIGFVLTAKSIARYNKIIEDPKFSEYYLLGTLISALLVVVTHLLLF